MYTQYEMVITSMHPCRDLLALGLKEKHKLDEEGEVYLLCLDAREFSCAPDKLTKITFWDNFDEHRIIIGEIREGDQIERLVFLDLKHDPGMLRDEDELWTEITSLLFRYSS